MFAVIVVTGSVMIFADMALIYMLPLLIVVGVILLLLLGAITPGEIKASFSKINFKRLREYPGFKQICSLKIFAKKTSVPKKNTKTPGNGKQSGIGFHLSSLVTSIHSLGHILSDRKKPVKKVEDINKMLDKTVSEKVKGHGAEQSPSLSGAAAGGALPADDDPFNSLSGDDLESGLLDSLDEPEADSTLASTGGNSGSAAPAEDELSMPELPPLPDATGAEASALSGSGGELEGLDGLDAESSLDSALGELDNLEIDEEEVGEESSTSQSDDASQQSGKPSETSLPATGGLIPAAPIVPPADTNLIPEASDSDLSTFAAGPTGTDEDMLSSLASEIKHIKKEKDISLLRELKDFKAPASDLEKELQEMTDQLINVGKNAAKKESATSHDSK